MDPLVIRPAISDDLIGLLDLYRHLHPSDPVIEQIQAELYFSRMMKQPGMTVLVAVVENLIIASITLVIIPNLTRNGASYALVENVVTHAEYRKRGHASALIRHAIEIAWNAGCYKVMLLTGSTNPATLRFYENCGFRRDKTGFHIRRP